MRVALYARVSTDSQQARGTIGSQRAVPRERLRSRATNQSPSSAMTASPGPGWTGPGATPRKPG